jgi:hypothetical protein
MKVKLATESFFFLAKNEKLGRGRFGRRAYYLARQLPSVIILIHQLYISSQSYRAYPYTKQCLKKASVRNCVHKKLSLVMVLVGGEGKGNAYKTGGCWSKGVNHIFEDSMVNGRFLWLKETSSEME